MRGNAENFLERSRKMKGIVFKVLVFTALAFAVSAGAQTWNCGGYENWNAVKATLSGGTLRIKGTGRMANFERAGGDGAGVAPWYGAQRSITNVVIENGVTSIGTNAFGGTDGGSYTKLISVTIPNSVTSIGGSAFSDCHNLKSITVTGSGKLAIDGFPNFAKVVIGDGITSIEDKTFLSCTNLTSITIPNSVTSIGNGAFARCTGLTSITIPNNVTSIGDSVFSGCTGLTSITIPNNVTSIGNRAFDGCVGLTSIEVAANNANYSSENGVLFNKDKTILIQYPGGKQGAYTIPNSVTSIGTAFSDCIGLTSITIPNSITSIGNKAFSGCSGLTSITIPNNITSIGDKVFSGCTGLTSVTIGDGVTSIKGTPFLGCTSLTSAVIGNGVKSIDMDVFLNCTGLTSIEIGTGNTHYRSENGVLFDKNKTVLILYPKGKQGASYAIPNGVISIGDAAFFGCKDLTSITIPKSVTSIGHMAFQGCIGLKSITIPNSVTSIGHSVFAGCANLTSVTTLHTTPPTLKYALFQWMDMTKICLYVPSSSIDAYRSAASWKAFSCIKDVASR